MKIFIITKEPFPNGMAAVKRIVSYAKGWISRGIGCEVIVYTRTEKYGVTPKNILGSGEIEGIPFRYIKGSPLREKNVALRVLNDYYDLIRLKKYLGKNIDSGDIVFAFNRPDIRTRRLIKFIHSKRAKFVQEICELPFGTSVENIKAKKKRKEVEKKIIPRLDGVIAISDALVDYTRQYCNSSCHIVKIPILVDFEKYYIENMSKSAEVPYIFHCGTLYQQKDGFVDMLKAFGMACRDLPFDVKFYSTGRKDGSRHESEIEEIITEYGLEDKVIFLGYLSDDEIKNYLSKAQFVVINKLTTLQNKYCFSTKLGEYMAAGKAVLITDIGEAMNWLTNGKDAYIIPPDDTKELADAIKKLFLDPDLCDKLGRNARQTSLDSFSIESNSEKLRDFALYFSNSLQLNSGQK